jgi:hypothetical protein
MPRLIELTICNMMDAEGPDQTIQLNPEAVSVLMPSEYAGSPATLIRCDGLTLWTRADPDDLAQTLRRL